MTPQPSIAHYRLTGKLGEGGMGEVWRAVDTKLSRDIAIKIIPETFAADPDRMARFAREAQVLAPDGRFLTYGSGSLGNVDLWILTVDAGDAAHPKAGSPEPFLKTPDNEQYPMFSPDGRWIAYMSPESGTSEIYVRPFRGAGKWQLSAGGGIRPKWSRAARQLFYNDSNGKLMVVEYTISGDEFKPGKPSCGATPRFIAPTADPISTSHPTANASSPFPTKAGKRRPGAYTPRFC